MKFSIPFFEIKIGNEAKNTTDTIENNGIFMNPLLRTHIINQNLIANCYALFY